MRRLPVSVERAFDLNAHFYSLNRDKSAYNPEISSVSEIISRHYGRVKSRCCRFRTAR